MIIHFIISDCVQLVLVVPSKKNRRPRQPDLPHRDSSLQKVHENGQSAGGDEREGTTHEDQHQTLLLMQASPLFLSLYPLSIFVFFMDSRKI